MGLYGILLTLSPPAAMVPEQPGEHICISCKGEQRWGVSRSRCSAPTPFYHPLGGKTQALSTGLPMARGMLHSMPVK